MGEHLKEQPFPLRNWRAGQGVVQSEMAEAHMMFLKQQEATGGSEYALLVVWRAVMLSKAPESVGTGGGGAGGHV